MVTASTELLLHSRRSGTGQDNFMSPDSGLYVVHKTMTIDGEMIPEPPHRLSRSYAEYIQDEDVNDWVAAKILIKRVLPMILDLKFTWARQEDSRKDDLLSTVLSSYPTFAKYKSSWPVMYYCHQSLGKMRHHRGETRKKHLNYSITSSVCTQRPMRRNRSQSVLSTATEVTVDRSSSATSIVSPQAPPTPSADVSPRYAEMMRGEQEVTSFLRSIDSTFSSNILDRFVSAGITSGARLEDMVKWNAADRNTFLRCEVRLNAFESKLVGDALQRMPASQS